MTTERGARSEEKGCPAVSDGVVYVGSDDKNLYAVDANTGQEIWAFKTGGPLSLYCHKIGRFSSPLALPGRVGCGSRTVVITWDAVGVRIGVAIAGVVVRGLSGLGSEHCAEHGGKRQVA